MTDKPRLILATLLALTCPAGIAFAQAPQESPMVPLYDCQNVADNVARLACFDEVVATLKIRESSGEIQSVDMAAIESIEKEAFGLSLPSLPSLFRSQSGGAEREPVAEITAEVKSAKIQPVSRKVIVVLANGQTWEQIDTANVSAIRVRKAKEAKIRKAAMGSFMLSLDGGSAFRAKRTS